MHLHTHHSRGLLGFETGTLQHHHHRCLHLAALVKSKRTTSPWGRLAITGGVYAVTSLLNCVIVLEACGDSVKQWYQ